MNEIDLKAFLQDLETLVNIDSGSGDIGGVTLVNQWIAGKFRSLGWMVEEKSVDPSVGPCLEIRNRSNTEKGIMILAHSDTVFPKGTAAARPFSMDAHKAYGPGVADMKSGLLSVYYAVRSLDPERCPPLCLAVNSHEEIGSDHAFPWIEDLARECAAVLVMEPARSNGDLVKQRKGVATFFLEFTGVSAHAGIEPEKGRSAIVELGHWVVALSKENDHSAGTSVNVGKIAGGSATNAVADKATAWVDIRYRDAVHLERIEALMNQWSQGLFGEGIGVSVTRKSWRPPMNPSQGSLELCDLVDDIASDLGISFSWASTGGGSDANFTAAVNIPTIDGLGPIGGGLHSDREYIEIDSIIPRTQLLQGILLHFQTEEDPVFGGP